MNFLDERLPPRFWDRCTPEPNSGCWLRTGTADRNGYTVFYWTKRIRAYAHRAAYEALVGPIPAGLELDHKCRVRNCVNPAHLEPVTHAENVRRGTGPAMLMERNKQRGAALTHCKHGHEFTSENTWRNKNGFRQCRTCYIAAAKRRYAMTRSAA